MPSPTCQRVSPTRPLSLAATLAVCGAFAAAAWSVCGGAPTAIAAVAGTSRPSAEITTQPAQQVTEAEAFELGIEAYHYFYPIISMEITRRVTTNLPSGVKPGFGPMNGFHHMREYPSAEFREVVRPNFDTLYSSAWIDLTKEPQIISAPDTKGRYYLLPMLDMWSNVFASPGKRTSGTSAGTWALVPRGWNGALPEGVTRIEAPSQHVWIIGRTQTNGPSDYDAVHAVQAGYKVTPLSQWGKPEVASVEFKPNPTVDMKTSPLEQVNTMTAEKYYSLGAELLSRHGPQPTDWSTVTRLARIGIRQGRAFDYAALPPPVRAALDRAPTAALAAMRQKLPTLARVTNGWQMNTDTMGVYGNAYLKRAIVALVGLGANQPEDAIYPLCVTDADGKPLSGEHRYELHFKKEQLPPVAAFWSVTMYDEGGFQVENPINRFAIGDRNALKFNSDGSLTLYIQHERPSADKESNWLPAPARGTLGVTMRLYAPGAPALDGRWNPPPIRRVP